jgi:retinol dehydrogenase 14
VREKIVVVTGASGGIGLEIVKGLAARGARVGMVCHSAVGGDASRVAVLARAPDALVDLFVADLSSRQEVRRLADEIGARYEQVDVLVNNAAAVYSRRVLSADGIEMQFAVNHLAYYALTRLLLPQLLRSGHARIVNVASRAHARGRIDFDDLNAAHGYFALTAYNQSKLANVLFTYELARRLAGTGTTANCCHPGLVRTRIGNKHTTRLHSLLHSLMCLFAVDAAGGARTPIFLATAPEVEDVTGTYFADMRPARSSAASHDPDLARRLWNVSAELTRLPPD